MSVDLTDAETASLRRRASTGRRPESQRLYEHAVARHDRRRRARAAAAVGVVIVLVVIVVSAFVVRRTEPPTVTLLGPEPAPSTPAPTTSSPSPAGPPVSAAPLDAPALVQRGGILVDDGGDLVVIDPDTGLRMMVQPGMVGSWSPDRRQLAAGTSSSTSDDGMSVMGLDGSRRRQVYQAVSARPSDPAWSPDGQRLTFTVPANNPDTIMVVNRDGSDLHQVGKGRYPTWSADGRSIFANTLDEHVQIQRIDVSTASSEVLPLGPGSSSYPVAGPTELAYVDGETGRVWISAPNGRDPRPISDCTRPACSADLTPRWSPDGRRLAFVRTAANGESTELVVVSVDSGQVVARFAPADPRRFFVESWR